MYTVTSRKSTYQMLQRRNHSMFKLLLPTCNTEGSITLWDSPLHIWKRLVGFLTEIIGNDITAGRDKPCCLLRRVKKVGKKTTNQVDKGCGNNFRNVNTIRREEITRVIDECRTIFN